MANEPLVCPMCANADLVRVERVTLVSAGTLYPHSPTFEVHGHGDCARWQCTICGTVLEWQPQGTVRVVSTPHRHSG